MMNARQVWMLGVLVGLAGTTGFAQSIEKIVWDPREDQEILRPQTQEELENPEFAIASISSRTSFVEELPRLEKPNQHTQFFLTQSFQQMDPVIDLLNKFRAGQILLDQMIFIGKKFLDLVKEGAPVVDLKLDRGHVLPKGGENPLGLTGWDFPKLVVQEKKYRNGHGKVLAHFAYRVEYTPGGRIDGQGRYLADVLILPHKIKLSGYGSNLVAESKVMGVTNMGPNEKEPIAAVKMLMQWRLKTLFSTVFDSESYLVLGDGKLKTSADLEKEDKSKE